MLREALGFYIPFVPLSATERNWYNYGKGFEKTQFVFGSNIDCVIFMWLLASESRTPNNIHFGCQY
jgi:hypothetical protein